MCLALATLLVVLPLKNFADPLRFTADWESDWQHLVTGDVCQLVLEIGAYGEARFVGSTSMAPVFELQARRDLHARGPLEVSQYAPPWHPVAGARRNLGELLHIEGGGALARDDMALGMLAALKQGWHLELTAPARYDAGRTVVLDVNARSLAPSLHNFLDCAHTQIAVSWEKMSRTRITYEVDDHNLNEDGQARLAALVRFVKEDPSITTLYVDGHTDDSGTSRKNYQLSKRRAETVAQHLRDAGLEEQAIVVRYHGEVYPVADNTSVDGKAMNRRTTVRLARGGGEALVSQ